MKETTNSVEDITKSVKDDQKHKDSFVLVKLIQKASSGKSKIRSMIDIGKKISLFTLTLIISSQQVYSTTFANDTLLAFDGRYTLVERRSFQIQETWGADSVMLEVTYLRLPANTPTQNSPIVFLMGGPGVPASIIARIPPYFTLFEQLRETADIILLDQRGVGFSKPNIDCSPGKPPPATFLYSTKDLFDALVATYRPCVASLRTRGIPPELFGVSNIAQDIETIRQQLGTPRISLLAFSYGTRIALEYARLFPEHVSRIALQGVLGFEHGIRLPSTLDSLFNRVSSLASRDPIAHSLVPNLITALSDQLKRLQNLPILVPIQNAAGDTVMITIGASGFVALISNQLADPRLPALLATLAQGDTRVLSLMVEGIYKDLSNGGGSLFGRAVYASAPPTDQRVELAHQLADSSMIHEVFDNMVTVTEFSKAIGISPGVPVGVPTRLGGEALLIEGSLDDRTPLGNASEIATLFRNSDVVTVQNGGHELLPMSHVQQLVLDFFVTGNVNQTKIIREAPKFLTIEQALQPWKRPGQ